MSHFENRVIEKNDIPDVILFRPEQLNVHYSHLESLSLVIWLVTKQDPMKGSSGTQTGIRGYSTIQLTELGRLSSVGSAIHGELNSPRADI